MNPRAEAFSCSLFPANKRRYRVALSLPRQTNGTLVLYDVSTNDAGVYRMLVINLGGVTKSEPAILTVTPVLGLPIALDAPTLYWRTGGNRPWLPQTNATHDGVHAAVSGGISHDEVSWIETTVMGPGTITFWWRVSCEPGFDKLRFFESGNLVDTISGETNWQLKSTNVAAGMQILRRVYSKDRSGSGGQDRAWLDQVVYRPNIGVQQPFYVLTKRRFLDGRFKLSSTGAANRRYVIQGSSNLEDWAQLATLTNVFGTLPFVDTEAGELPRRFYRALEAQ